MANNGRLFFDPAKPEDRSRHQKLLDLKAKEGWGDVQIAAYFGISIPTVIAWLKRPVGYVAPPTARRKAK
jgi:transposase